MADDHATGADRVLAALHETVGAAGLLAYAGHPADNPRPRADGGCGDDDAGGPPAGWVPVFALDTRAGGRARRVRGRGVVGDAVPLWCQAAAANETF